MCNLSICAKWSQSCFYTASLCWEKIGWKLSWQLSRVVLLNAMELFILEANWQEEWGRKETPITRLETRSSQMKSNLYCPIVAHQELLRLIYCNNTLLLLPMPLRFPFISSDRLRLMNKGRWVGRRNLDHSNYPGDILWDILVSHKRREDFTFKTSSWYKPLFSILFFFSDLVKGFFTLSYSWKVQFLVTSNLFLTEIDSLESYICGKL